MPELIWEGKYGVNGKQVAPLRVALPFQTIETVNESAQDRQRSMLFAEPEQTEWRNRLIWGDKKYVLPALVAELAGTVDLIYIDPPFFTGDDFSFSVEVGDEQFERVPSIIERKAYRDTWGSGPDGYLAWFHSSLVQLRELLNETGSIYVHLDWHVGHLAKLVLDEVFGVENFRNEIIWHYYNKFQGNVSALPPTTTSSSGTRSRRGTSSRHKRRSARKGRCASSSGHGTKSPGGSST
jgi:adenine specific DNA methylase Mod